MAETSTLKTFRTVLWTLVVVAAIGATALFFFRPAALNPAQTLGSASFNLVDQRNQPVTETIFRGSPTLLFFGYTHCPDVCPTTMGEMQGWFAALGDDARNLKGVFVTVDPARDTPEILEGYVSWVSDRVTALTGPQAEIDRVVKSWGASAKREGDGEDYLVSHSASVFMIDANGEFFGTIAYGEATETALQKIRRLIGA